MGNSFHGRLIVRAYIKLDTSSYG